MNLRDAESVSKRRKLLEKQLNLSLPHIGKYSLDEVIASTRNCENMIGVAQVPMGIAGPLKLQSSLRADSGQAKLKVQSYYVPLATTEGALVASVNRGCRVISESGGADVMSFRAGVTRGPVFEVADMAANSCLYDFLLSHEKEIRRIAESTSPHLKYMSFITNSTGRYRFIRFNYDTRDAMGMNMVTIATDSVCRYITEKTGAKVVSLTGNYCSDKKPSWINITHGRGFEVWAEAKIPASVVKSILKTTPEAFCRTWIAKCMIGSAMSGSMAYNAHFANILAAVFIACGQDPAHVAECAVGITTAEVLDNRDLYVSVYLPDLMVGTVGGGTGLATQKEALQILGVAGGNDGKNAERLAQIIGGAVLAGEISLLASLSEGSLTDAHRRLSRG